MSLLAKVSSQALRAVGLRQIPPARVIALSLKTGPYNDFLTVLEGTTSHAELGCSIFRVLVGVRNQSSGAVSQE